LDTSNVLSQKDDHIENGIMHGRRIVLWTLPGKNITSLSLYGQFMKVGFEKTPETRFTHSDLDTEDA
jgi:hypothetical protein